MNSIRKCLHLVLALQMVSGMAWAEPSTRDSSLNQQLRRSSLILRGTLPELSEYSRVESRGFSQVRILVNDYTDSAGLRSRLLSHLHHLFRITDERGGALTTLFSRIVNGNEPWDELLLATNLGLQSTDMTPEKLRTYFDVMPQTLPPQMQIKNAKNESLAAEINAILKARNVRDIKPLAPDQAIPTELKSDSNVTGALATSEFYSRYADTAVNRGRRRAAAVFRIFLCDSMAPAVPVNAQDDQAQLNLVLGTSAPQKADPKAGNASQEAQHGVNPQCKSCHVKLDPAGELMRLQTPERISNVEKPGALVLRRADGTLLEMPVKSLSEFSRKLVQLPEYKSCQVRTFWNWFVGEDVSLPADLEQELVQKFDDVEHRPISFIKILTERPEFLKRAYSGPLVTYAQVRPLLRNCTSCHENNPQAPKARFDSLPVGGNMETHLRMLGLMALRLDAEHAGLNNTMPPASSQWQLTNGEKNLILTWLKDGAPNDLGEPTISPSQTRELKVSDKVPRPAKGEASYGFGFHRLFDSFTLRSVLQQISRDSSNVSDERLRRMGGMSLINGRPLQPRLSTVDLEVLGATYQRQSFTVQGLLAEEIKYLTPVGKEAIDGRKDWNSLSATDKKTIARAVVYKMIGPGILPDEESVVTALVESIKVQNTDINSVLAQMLGALASGVKEFLTI